MFSFLSKLFASDPYRSEDVEPDPHLSDARILREHFSVSQDGRRALRTFVSLAAAPLGPAEAKRLSALVHRAIYKSGSSAAQAWGEGLLGENGQRRGKWLVISTDWKASDEIEWQAHEIIQSLGISDHWNGASLNTVREGLSALAAWLSERGFTLLSVDSECDSYYAFAAPKGKVDELMRLSIVAGLNVSPISENLP